MNGILYLCGTPIGNLGDITPRIIETLKSVDIIACEDTRHTMKLLNHYDIKAKLTSYHEHNKHSKGQELVNLLLSGKNIALVTDAGMPAISDPGEDLVALCYSHDITVTSCPSATAVITALVLSGLSTRRYIFEGFLPKDKKERIEILSSFQTETRTIVFYESPHQLLKTISELAQLLPHRQASVVRELTKKHEEVIRGNFSDIEKHFLMHEVRGEFVIVVAGESKEKLKKQAEESWLAFTIEQHMQIYLEQNIPKKEAIKIVAKERGMNKRELYSLLI